MKKLGVFLVMLIAMALLSACNDAASTSAERERGEGGIVRRDPGIFSVIGSALAVNNATSNFGDELSERFATTPFQVFGMLWDSLNYGTTTVSFNYRDEWTHRQTGERNVLTNSGNISLHSDMDNLDFALRGDITADGENFDFSVFLNRNRAAVGSSLIGDYYGIDFRTLRQDLTRLGDELGLDAADIGMFADIFDQVMAEINTPAPAVANESYLFAIIALLTGNELITDDVEISNGREMVEARRVAYTFTDTTLFNFFRDWLSMMENDDSMLAAFDNPFMDAILEDMFGRGATVDTLIRELRDGLRILESEISGDITVAFYIGRGDRLLRVDAEMNLNVYDEDITVGFTLGLGDSATDIWRLELRAEDYWDTYTISFVWEIRESGGRYINDFDMTVREGRWVDTYTLTSEWNPAGGEFVLSFSEDGWREELLRGNFTTSGGTFRLSFSNINECCCWNETLSIEISTARGANIGNVNFINIAGLSLAQLESLIEDAFGGFGANFAASDEWWWDEELEWAPLPDGGFTWADSWFMVECWQDGEWYNLHDMISMWDLGWFDGTEMIRWESTWELFTFNTWEERFWAGYFGWDW